MKEFLKGIIGDKIKDLNASSLQFQYRVTLKDCTKSTAGSLENLLITLLLSFTKKSFHIYTTVL